MILICLAIVQIVHKMHVHVSIMVLPHCQDAAQALTKLVTLFYKFVVLLVCFANKYVQYSFSVTSNEVESDSLKCCSHMIIKPKIMYVSN